MKRLTVAGGVLVACIAAGCSERTEQEAREAGRQTAEAARAAGETVASAAQDAVNNVERASEKAADAARDARRESEVGETANEAGDAVAAAAQTAKVKTALAADSSVDAVNIDVDTDARTKAITLKGYVPSPAQKTAAGRIASEKASDGYTVVNNLEVRARPRS